MFTHDTDQRQITLERAAIKRDSKLLSVGDFMVSSQQGKDKRHISAARAISDR